MLAGDFIEEDQSIVSIFGIYFCNSCKNMITPSKSLGNNILEFHCVLCGPQEVDFTKRRNNQCMLYSKELHAGTKKFNPDTSIIFDPTMPRVKITCPDCDHDVALYFLTPDEGERKIVTKLICASATETTAKCGHMWELSDDDFLDKYVVKENGNKM